MQIDVVRNSEKEALEDAGCIVQGLSNYSAFGLKKAGTYVKWSQKDFIKRCRVLRNQPDKLSQYKCAAGRAKRAAQKMAAVEWAWWAYEEAGHDFWLTCSALVDKVKKTVDGELYEQHLYLATDNPYHGHEVQQFLLYTDFPIKQTEAPDEKPDELPSLYGSKRNTPAPKVIRNRFMRQRNWTGTVLKFLTDTMEVPVGDRLPQPVYKIRTYDGQHEAPCGVLNTRTRKAFLCEKPWKPEFHNVGMMRRFHHQLELQAGEWLDSHDMLDYSSSIEYAPKEEDDMILRDELKGVAVYAGGGTRTSLGSNPHKVYA